MKDGISLPDEVKALGALVRLRRHAQLRPAPGEDAIYLVASGVLLLNHSARNAVPEVLQIYLPRDVIDADSLPRIDDLRINAATECYLLRIKPERLEEAIRSNGGSVCSLIMSRRAAMLARQTMHVANLANLSGEARIASLILDLAARFGVKCADGIAFDLPLSRTEMASYLGLNADTLSRLMSRLKTKGLVAFNGRRHALVRDIAKLKEESPHAAAIELGAQAG